ncbi:MAG TPA: hypothetical protein VF011_09295 [Terriglobales bacterium]
MEIDTIEFIELELKYCERCGGLWLRIVGEERVYCAACVPQMAQFPPVKMKCAKNNALRPSEDLEGVGEIYGILCAEGHA